MKNKGLGCLLAFFILALLVSVAVNFAQFAALAGMGMGVEGALAGLPQPKKKFTESLIQESKAGSKDRIVRIDLDGIITSTAAGDVFSSAGMDVGSIQRALEQAVEDAHVKAIVLKVNSPGGEVTASDTLYHAVKQAAAKKKVVVYMDSMAASGGYYLACGASRIVANETTLTGSIGVIIQSINYTQTFGKVGLEPMTFTSGKFKDTLSGSRPMREDERAYIQSLVDDMYSKFVGIVAEARKLDEATLRAGVADGRVLTGREALKARLVDQLGYIEDAYDLARELGGSKDAMVVKYSQTTSLAEIFGVFGQAQSRAGTVKLDVSDRLIPRLESGRPYLLPTHMVP